jgi:hypothetical protein
LVVDPPGEGVPLGIHLLKLNGLTIVLGITTLLPIMEIQIM